MSRFQIFSQAEIAAAREGGKILRACLEETAGRVREGMRTEELDHVAEAFIRSRGAEPAFKGYHGFPATLCISVNDECVHGIPGARELRQGDIVALDCGVLHHGIHTDSCVTVSVGEPSEENGRLMTVTLKALKETVSMVRSGIRVGDLSSAIQRTVEDAGFHCVRSLTGHGVGTHLHQFPDIPNQGEAGTGALIPAFTLLAIEPITAVGSPSIRQSKDGWAIHTADGSTSAHFEHTVLVLPEGVEIIA